MKSLIIGGGKIGYNLFKTLREKSHYVTLIERNKDTCIRIADELDTDVICGDGTDLEVLKDAGIERADIVAAVTGTDEENMVICQIAKLSFAIKTTIARVNNPKNIEMFKALGIDRIVCSTAVIADMIEYEVDQEEYRVVQTFERGSMVLAEITVGLKNSWRNQKIKDLDLPEECLFVSVFRSGKVIFPKVDTVILKNDKALIVASHTALRNLSLNLHNGV